jgi:hypothetical protein
MNTSLCDASDALCQRLQRLEPTLPLRAPVQANDGQSVCRNGQCFPLYHIFGAYHSFLEESLGTGKGAHGAQRDGLLSGHSMVEMLHRCHNEFDGGGTFEPQGGGAAFLSGWSRDKVLIAECMTGLMWYPNLAGRWSREWSAAYWPCKAAAVKEHGHRAFSRKLQWQRCKPRALAAHDAAHGVGGVGQEATPPFLLRMLYPASVSPRALIVIRHPTERLEVIMHGAPPAHLPLLTPAASPPSVVTLTLLCHPTLLCRLMALYRLALLSCLMALWRCSAA